MKKDVILVENDRFSIELTKRLVSNLCNLDIAIDGYTALEMVKSKSYSLILLDINLGVGPNGLEILKEIRSFKGYENVPVIAMTAYAMQSEKENILKNGVDYYMVKPININEFQKLVTKVLA
jgi:CheY-like chemotaxis protein